MRKPGCKANRPGGMRTRRTGALAGSPGPLSRNPRAPGWGRGGGLGTGQGEGHGSLPAPPPQRPARPPCGTRPNGTQRPCGSITPAPESRGDGGHAVRTQKGPLHPPTATPACADSPSPTPKDRGAGRLGLRGRRLPRPPGRASSGRARRSVRRRVPAYPRPSHPLGTQLGRWGPGVHSLLTLAGHSWPRCGPAASPVPQERSPGRHKQGLRSHRSRRPARVSQDHLPGSERAGAGSVHRLASTGAPAQPPGREEARPPLGGRRLLPPPAWGPPAAPGQGDGFE